MDPHGEGNNRHDRLVRPGETDAGFVGRRKCSPRLVQLFALGLITHSVKKRSTTDRNKYWSLTPLGHDELMKLRAIKKGEDVVR